MIQRALWFSGMLAIVLHSANAEEARLHPPRHGTSSAPVSRILYDVAPTPQYLILRQTASGVAQPTVGRPYAYGWFGAAPRRHTMTHQGYYGSHWLFPGRIAP